MSQRARSLQPRLVPFRPERPVPMTHIHKSGVVVPFRAPAAAPLTPLLNKFTAHVGPAKTADAILNGLDEFASKLLPVNVLGVGRMPQRTSDWRSIELGKDVFLHRSAPVEWWNEYAAKAAQGYDPGIMMAKTSLVAYTWTETMQMLEPIGIDRWPYDLALKYGIRDALTCSVAWSERPSHRIRGPCRRYGPWSWAWFTRAGRSGPPRSSGKF